MRLRGHGFDVDVPSGWDARIFRRAESPVEVPGVVHGMAAVPQSGLTQPAVHLANFALPEVRGDYGSGAIDRMGPDHVFLALVEFGPESVGTPLFAPVGIPKLRVSEITAATMQRPMPPRGGAQRFFVAAGRPLCCYAVVGSVTRRSSLVPVLNRGLAGVTVEPN